MRLVTCPLCQQYLRASERRCVHCGAAVRWTAAVASAAVFGLCLYACEARAETTGTTGSGGEDDTTGEAETAASTTGATEASTEAEGGSDSTEDTGSANEPLYGAPGTGLTCSAAGGEDSLTGAAGLVLLLGLRRRRRRSHPALGRE